MLFTQEERELISGHGRKLQSQGSVLDEDVQFKDVFCEEDTETEEELNVAHVQFSDFKNMEKVKNWSVLETYQGFDMFAGSNCSMFGDDDQCARSCQDNVIIKYAEDDVCSKFELTPAVVIPRKHADIEMEDDYEEIMVEDMEEDEEIKEEVEEVPEVSIKESKQQRNCNRLTKDKQALLTAIYFIFPFKNMQMFCELMGEEFIDQLINQLNIKRNTKKERYSNLDQKFRRTTVFKQLAADRTKKSSTKDGRLTQLTDDLKEQTVLRKRINEIYKDFLLSDGTYVFKRSVLSHGSQQ